MRWLGFSILAVVGWTLQSSIAWRLEIWGVRPDWLLVLVVFFALHARGREALLAGWILGMGADLMTLERFGLVSLCYGCCAGGVYWFREYFFHDHPLTHFALTLVPALVVGAALRAFSAFSVGAGAVGLGSVALEVLLAAVYTAVWAPPVHFLLGKLPGLLGVKVKQYRHRGGRTVRGGHV